MIYDDQVMFATPVLAIIVERHDIIRVSIRGIASVAILAIIVDGADGLLSFDRFIVEFLESVQYLNAISEHMVVDEERIEKIYRQKSQVQKPLE